MAKTTPIHIVIFLAILSASSLADDSQFPVIKRLCYNVSALDPATFDVNFIAAMESVSQQIARDGFGTSVSGNSTNRVYGLGQCLGYLSSIDCRLCYAQSRVSLPVCLPVEGGRIYLDGCFLRYENWNFPSEAMDDKDTVVCDYSKNSSNPNDFRELAGKLVRNLSLGEGHYRAGRFDGSRMTVYGVAQCWRSLDSRACSDCLTSAANGVRGCLPAKEGRALNAGCFLRYSTSPFYLQQSGSGRGSIVTRHQLAVALGSIFAGALVISVAIILVRRRRRGRDSSFDSDDMEGSSEIIKAISQSHLGFKYEDLRKATKNFEDANKLGQGGYGSVYKGVLSDGRVVAVKRLFFNTRQWVDQFFNEVNLISRVQHKNLVKLLGCSVEGPESLLVYEYLSNSSLDRFLFDPFRRKLLDWRRRFDIIVGTAEGLAYLHDASEVRIIHRDIKASNILLDEKFRPKIADFGLARYFAEDQSHLSTGIAGTLGYMAPEYVIHGQLTEKADIYSYGVLVLEMVTGRKNNNSISTSVEGHSLMSLIWKQYSSNTLLEIVDPNIQGLCSEEQILRVFHVGLLCTQASPTLRPPMWKVVELLVSMGKELPLPTQPPFIDVKGVESNSDGSETSYLFSSTSKSHVSINGMSVSMVRGR
ncbi:hypothetical protein AMTRI_Chr02g265820 [Amborella trichopoda]